MSRVRCSLTNDDLPLPVPNKVATCPVCGATLSVIAIQEWTTGGSAGDYGALVVDCSSRPAEDDVSMVDWSQRHHISVVQWLKMEDAILPWFNAWYTYRFYLELIPLEVYR
jgi:hypothetical protein